MGVEIERKFLVGGEYKSLSTSHSFIAQGYICSARGRTVRVRVRDDRGYLTIKGPAGADGLRRYEWEKEIPVGEARELLLLCETPPLEKTRWLVPCGRHTFEVDEFHGENAGLVVAEVELAQEDEAYECPPFLGREVTGDVRYYNSFLTHTPYSRWTDKG